MATMSTRRHLRELQWRFLLVAVFFIIGASLAYAARDAIIPLLMAPLHGERLVYLNPAGGFSFIFLVSMYAGIALAFPLFLHQAYSFLRPALPKTAQKKSALIIIASCALLLGGIAFGYFVAVPNALSFLYGFADAYIEASLTADSYLSFIVAYTVGVGIVFQLPLLLLLIHAVRPLTPGGLMRSERWVILLAFVLAAIVTPTPDPINQAIIALPIVGVYQLGVCAVLWSVAKARHETKRQFKQAHREEQAKGFITPEILPKVFEMPTQTTVARAQTTQRARRTIDGFQQTSRRPAAARHHSPLLTPVTPHTPTQALPVRKRPTGSFSMDGVRPVRRAAS